MGVIYLLLAISITVAIVFFIAFVAAVRKGQYDDSYTPSVRMLFDDEMRSPGQEQIQEEERKPRKHKHGNTNQHH